jgi:hypothetical protein
MDKHDVMIVSLHKEPSQRVPNAKRMERCVTILIRMGIIIWMNLLKLYSANEVEFSNMVHLVIIDFGIMGISAIECLGEILGFMMVWIEI